MKRKKFVLSKNFISNKMKITHSTNETYVFDMITERFWQQLLHEVIKAYLLLKIKNWLDRTL